VYGFLLHSEIFFRTRQELEYLFLLSCNFFFPELNIRLYDKNSESDYRYIFFLHQNQNIFFSNIGNQNIFLEKKHDPPTPPFKLNGCSLKGIIDDIINTAVKTAEVDEQETKYLQHFINKHDTIVSN
jgi:hypothetical protein